MKTLLLSNHAAKQLSEAIQAAQNITLPKNSEPVTGFKIIWSDQQHESQDYVEYLQVSVELAECEISRT